MNVANFNILSLGLKERESWYNRTPKSLTNFLHFGKFVMYRIFKVKNFNLQTEQIYDPFS